MTDEQLNEAIAEACGWTKLEQCTCKITMRGMPPEGFIDGPHIPDYCNNLNAIHKAESSLNINQLWDMAYTIDLPLGLNYRATARQRAEAFLRTIGKWKTTTEESSVDQFEAQP